MHTLLRTSAALLFFATVGSAQLLPAPPSARRNPSDLPIPSSLYGAWLARELPLAELRERVGPGFVTVDDARRLHVEILAPRGSLGVSDEFVGSFGGSVDARWLHRVEAWVPLDFLLDLTRALPSGHRLARPSPGEPQDIAGEGPTVMGSAPWKAGGANGAGKTIAILDGGFAGLSAAVANGDAPSSYTAINLTQTSFEGGSNVHGTACVEQVFDHAPGATYRLYKSDSATDLPNILKDCKEHGVDIISRSLGIFDESWWDDESILCEEVGNAAATGIVWVNSAGNYADKHWEGKMNGGVGSPDWHDWVTGDELQNITVPAGESLRLYLLWNDDPSGSEDYDLYLYDTALNEIASSTNANEFFESLTWTNNSASDVVVLAAVWRYSGAATQLELFAEKYALQYAVAGSSVPPGLSCTNSALVVVGAVNHNEFGSPAGTTGIVTDYSSRGPSNSGNDIIDLVAPDGITCLSYPGGFNGTSCAAPNVAGLTACLWSSAPAYSPDAIRWLVRRHGSVFKPWGAAGYDHLYGHGGGNLIDFQKDTRWLTLEYANPNGLTNQPANSLAAALNQTPVGGRIVAFPGGFYPPDPILLAQPVTLVSRGATAFFAD